MIEACEGDRVTITVRKSRQHLSMPRLARTADRHDARRYRGAERLDDDDEDRRYAGRVHVPCASGPVTDLPIKSGLVGLMIVYPGDHPLRPVRELVVLERAIYGDRAATGSLIRSGPRRTTRR